MPEQWLFKCEIYVDLSSTLRPRMYYTLFYLIITAAHVIHICINHLMLLLKCLSFYILSFLSSVFYILMAPVIFRLYSSKAIINCHPKLFSLKRHYRKFVPLMRRSSVSLLIILHGYMSNIMD